MQRVGSIEARKVDVRITAATNRDLRAEVAAGRFRGDLYYRLNIAEIVLPPLRDRREDIPYLTAVFVRQCAERFGKTLSGLTPAAERLLADGRWEGNVRQLRNVIERVSMLASGEFITELDLTGLMLPVMAAPVPATAPRAELPAPLMEIEREHIVKTLEQVRGNKAVAARLLGISRRAFYRQLERHGLHHRVPMGSSRADATPAGSPEEGQRAS